MEHKTTGSYKKKPHQRLIDKVMSERKTNKNTGTQKLLLLWHTIFKVIRDIL